MFARKPYQGRLRALVVAFDVGTTYSGISYAILDPGEVPRIQGVTRYPAQEHVGGDCKIPSVVYYDLHGQPRAFGAEALQDHILDQAEDEHWHRLEWWKLHLRAKHLAAGHISDDDLPPIPLGKSAVDVLADFLRYLFSCTQRYIEDAHGVNLWKSVENQIEYVLTHPNGWEGPQQKQIRRAATLAGLVSAAPDGQEKVHLLTEGEAGLHYCVASILAAEAVARTSVVSIDPSKEEEPRPQGVVVIDAGGGTIDVSAYAMRSHPPSFDEIAPAECRLQGSVMVTRRASSFLRRRLEGSKYCSPEILKQMTEIFDKTTKLRLRNADDPQYIKFGTVRDKDPQYDIRSGQLRLSGKIVADLFEPSIREIVDAFKKQQQASPIPITSVYLVGGFAASEWLVSCLRRHFEALNVSVCRPDSHVNKAVADGAIAYHLDHLVSSRVAKLTYGTECSIPYNISDGEHRARQKSIYRGPTGQLALPNAFASILTRGTPVGEKQEFQETFAIRRSSQAACHSLDIAIVSYRGPLEQPTWMDGERDHFSTLCTVRADTTKLAKSLSPKRTAEGALYYALDIKIILLFGMTELTAQVGWVENGVEVRSPAVVVYGDAE